MINDKYGSCECSQYFTDTNGTTSHSKKGVGGVVGKLRNFVYMQRHKRNV